MSKPFCNGDLPAFPVHPDITSSSDSGLTKREYFAAMVISGRADRQGDDYESVAKWAVLCADYLIEALNKEPSHPFDGKKCENKYCERCKDLKEVK